MFPTKDSYVDDYYPSSNYGGRTNFAVGDYFLGMTEAYFEFETGGRPANWEQVVFGFYVYYASETKNVDVYLVEGAWQELGITWATRPALGAKIANGTVAVNQWYNVNMTGVARNRTTIGICLVASTSTPNGYLNGFTKEYSTTMSPRLAWGCPPPDVTWVVIVIVGGITGVAILLAIRHKRKVAQPPPSAPPVEERIDVA